MQRPDKALEGASDILRQPETAVDLETDEAAKHAASHPGGVDRLVTIEPVAPKRGDDGLNRKLSRCHVLRILGVGHALGQRVAPREGQRIVPISAGRDRTASAPDRPAMAVEKAFASSAVTRAETFCCSTSTLRTCL